MNIIQKKILLGFLFIPAFFLVSFIFGSILAILGNVDEYGTPKNKYFGLIYNVFNQRDGLYDRPNIYFYLLVTTITILFFKYVFIRLLKDKD